MTEKQWLRSADPEKMLKFIGRNISQRKRRLFACACCRRVWDLISDPRSQMAVIASEKFADGLLSSKEVEIAKAEARKACKPFKLPGLMPAVESYTTEACSWVISKNAGEAIYARFFACLAKDSQDEKNGESFRQRDKNSKEELAFQCSLLRDMVGPKLFKELPTIISCESNWKNPRISRIAQKIYDGRAFKKIRRLADALEEAGCTDAEILSHCRSQTEHVRGCWVLDLILGKE